MPKLTVGLIVLLITAAAVAADRPPNIVLIFADDLGWGDVGFNGRTSWQTPNLDRLAQQGMQFNRWYTGGVVCTPSRAVLLTGKYTIHCGVTANNQSLPPEEVTIAEALKPAGYATALFGKWHLSAQQDERPVHPMDQGFDEFFGFIGGGHAWQKFPKELIDGRNRVPSQGYADTLFADRTIDFIRRKKDQPFFAYLAVTASHGLVEAPEEEVAKHKGKFEETDPNEPLNATYAAMVTRMDSDIGRIMETLEELNLIENTIVLFTSDHGATFERMERGTTYYHDSNYPFRGQKRTLWEGGIRVPGVIHWPARVSGGHVSHELVHMIDVMPTLLEAAGVKTQDAWEVDGISILPLLTERKSLPERTLFFEWRGEGYDQVAAMRGDLKLVITGGTRPELFNVVHDQAERKTLHAIEQEMSRRLEKELRSWLETETPHTLAAREKVLEQQRQRQAQRGQEND